MKKWIIILLLMPITWYFIDVRSDNGFQSLFLPLLFSILSLMVFIKLLLLLGIAKGAGSGGTTGIGSDYTSGHNGDCGGGE